MKIEIEKPVIPQFVADWIEEAREERYYISNLFAKKLSSEMRVWSACNSFYKEEMVATAFLHGYEVEQEPLYYAKIKGWEHIGTTSYYFGYDEDNDSLEVTYLESNYHFAFSLTKKHWNKLGINDTNADFEEVE